MAYRVVFTDKTQVSVGQEQGKKLIELQASVTKPAYVMIKDSSYKLSTISKIISVPDDIKTLPMIDSGMVKRCEGSIHREIYRLYMKELKRDQPRTWEEFKAKAYDYLYGKKQDWCDYTKGGCICKDRKEEVPVPVSTERVKEVSLTKYRMWTNYYYGFYEE